MKEKIVLVDGHSILNRAFYGLPDLTSSKGTHTGAVHGFLSILFKFLEEEKPDYLAVAFDVHHPTFRHEMYPEYKGTRKPMPEELREQVPIIRQVLAAMKVTICELPGFEADDILGTMAKKSEEMGREVSVVSGDRDLLQLATENICIRIPKTKQGSTTVENYHAEDVKSLYGVTPLQFIDMKALMGDASDNIPGVPGIGEKGAGAIIAAYGSIENAFAHVEEIKPKRAKESLAEHYDMAQLSKTLATIDVNAPVKEEWLSCAIPELYTPEAYEMLKDLELKVMAARFHDRLKDVPVKEDKPLRFARVERRGEAAEVFARAKKAGKMGLHAEAEDGRFVGLSLCFSDEKNGTEVYVFPAAGAEKPVFTQLTLFGDAEESEEVRAAAQENPDALTEEWLRGQAKALFDTEKKDISGKEEVSGKEEASGQEGISEKEETPETTGFAFMDYKAFLNWLPEAKKGMPRVFDAGVCAYLLNPLKNSYAFDDVARDILGQTVPSRKEMLGKKTMRELAAERGETFLSAVGYPAYIAFLAAEKGKELLSQQGMLKLYEEMELPLIPVLHDMEAAGVKVQKDELEKYGEKLQVRIEELTKEIVEEAGEDFNLNSPKQLGEILFEKMKLPGGKKTKTGYSTAADVLEKLAVDVPFVRKILEYRQYAKLKSTYADSLGSYIREDGRIHSVFNQTVTATGRLSSADPNLQNIPVRMELGREIRKLFVPEDGFLLVDADYSQIELRVLASMSGDEQLIEAYNQAQDIHAITASKVFHVPLSEVTPLMRRNAKAVNFGIVYGISAFGLSEDLSISRKQATEYIEQYFATYPKVKAFLDKLVSDAKKKGYTETLFGRRRPMPELKASGFMQRSFGERVAMNAPIQGTAADIIKLAMIKVVKRLQEENCRARLILQVHDELILEAPEEEKEKVSAILAEEMQNAAQLKVRLEVDLHTGKSWFDAK
ncbi:MAG: DNA polymerase I [Lachnospiraceae bacterium]|nr:DNA polymerase I [Lachnospiraceae bacterium]